MANDLSKLSDHDVRALASGNTRAFHEDPEPEKQDVLYGFSFQNLIQCQKL